LHEESDVFFVKVGKKNPGKGLFIKNTGANDPLIFYTGA